MAEQTTSRSNPTLFLGLILAVVVALLMFLFATSLQGKGKVYVAKNNIPAYSVLVPGQNIVLKDVPEDSITDNDLTEKDVKDSNGQLVSRLEILQDGRVDRRSASASTTGTLGVVKKDKEVVITLEATYKGIVAGIVGPGSVVDVYNGEPSSEDAGALATEVKVLGVGQGTSASSNITTDSGKSGSSEGNDATVFVVVAVPIDKAGALAGLSSVSLAVDPYKSFDKNGNLCEISKCAGGVSGTSSQSSSPTDSSGTTSTSGAATSTSGSTTDTSGTTGTDTSGTTGTDAGSGRIGNGGNTESLTEGQQDTESITGE